MSSKVKFKWNKIEEDAFNEIKRVVDRDTLLSYPDFNEVFKIHTNANDFQFGAVISHKVKPVAFYSRTLTGSQKSYTVT